MLYVGSFSYNDETDDKDNYCLMPCVVEASTSDEALDRFAAHFQEVRRSSDLLDGAHEIFLDSLVELEGVPAEPVICQWQKIVPAMDGLCSITSALPETDLADDFASAYGWGVDDDEYEDDEGRGDTLEHDDEDPEGYPEEPFLRF